MLQLRDITKTKLYNSLVVENFAPNETVFKYDDLGTKYYIILKGKVDLLLPKHVDNSYIEESIETLLPHRRTSNILTPEEYYIKYYKEFEFKKTFKPGESFGEIAILTQSKRTGTMICREESTLITLDKNNFEILMGEYHLMLKQEKLNFM